jgi:hypothetical protein
MKASASDADKREGLKDIIKRLHEGEPLEEVKRRFDALVRGVSAEEIAEMEQALIAEGFPPQEIQRLCEVHVAVFEKSLSMGKKPKELPGHPVHTFMEENRALRPRIRAFLGALRPAAKGRNVEAFKERLADLKKVIIHYERKENQLFPLLEEKGFTGPSKVMWGKHDEARALFKEVEAALEEPAATGGRALKAAGRRLASLLRMLAFMEERILLPTALKKLDEADWIRVRRGEEAIGYAWVKPGDLWDANMRASALGVKEDLRPARGVQEGPGAAAVANAAQAGAPVMGLKLHEGVLSFKQLSLMLQALPLDVTYVDEHDKVRYYSDTRHRVFPRSPAIIGRDVRNCHPPKSLGVVERILESFRKKEKDVAEFWIEMGGRFIHIRYFALYDEEGAYRGVIEVSQDVTDIRALKGERRLLDW